MREFIINQLSPSLSFQFSFVKRLSFYPTVKGYFCFAKKIIKIFVAEHLFQKVLFNRVRKTFILLSSSNEMRTREQGKDLPHDFHVLNYFTYIWRRFFYSLYCESLAHENFFRWGGGDLIWNFVIAVKWRCQQSYKKEKVLSTKFVLQFRFSF